MSCTSVKSYALSFLYFFLSLLKFFCFLEHQFKYSTQWWLLVLPSNPKQTPGHTKPKKKKRVRVWRQKSPELMQTLRVLVGFPGIKALFREVRACWLDVQGKASWHIKGDPWPPQCSHPLSHQRVFIGVTVTVTPPSKPSHTTLEKKGRAVPLRTWHFQTRQRERRH